MNQRTKLLLSLLIGVVLIHLPSLWGGFVWDDHQLIEQNTDLEDARNVPGFFRTNYFGDRGDAEVFRPLVNVSLLLDYHAWGNDPAQGAPRPFGFHLTNLLLHLANGILLYLLLRRLTTRPVLPEAAALVFLVHPASAEPVAWIVARGDLLALLFTLAAIHLHLSGRRRPWLHALAPLAYLAGLFGKLAAGPAPLLIFIVEWLFRGLRPRDLIARKNLWRYASYALPVVLYCLVRGSALGSVVPRDDGLTWKEPERIASIFVAAAVLARCAGVFLLPAGLSAEYTGDPVSRTSELTRIAQSPAVLLLCCVVVLLLFSAVYYGRRRPWFAFGVLWFFLALLPVSQVIRIGAVMADRFQYLPAAGGAAALAAILLAVPRYRALFGVVVLASLAAMTVVREGVWQSDFTMNRDVLRATNYPENSDAWNRLGLWWSGRGRTEKEEEAYRRGLRHDPKNRDLLKNVGAFLHQRGEWEEARGFLELAYRLSPKADLLRAKIANNLAWTYERLSAAYLEDPERASLAEDLGRRAGELRDEAKRAGIGD